MSDNSDDIYRDEIPEDEQELSSYDEDLDAAELNAELKEGSGAADSERRRPYTSADAVVRHHLRGMYQTWFLEYASYVILERAVPHIDDGLKPVQRRILHAMKTIDDERFNKVANIVGTTMQYHPHGDASIKDALVQLGQKELLVETQGNWGNILTGTAAAAARYIEARLSPFATEVLFNPKVTEWTLSYDGRKREPVTLPAKFPLLLAQGAEGIAVGLSSKILPHNFNEILDAAIAYVRGEDFELYPDFITGGMIDVARYNDGRRGGAVKVRAKIEKVDQRTLNITELPFGKTSEALIESILKAFERGQIKIRKVENNTAAEASIIVHLIPGTSSDKTIDALYAFTDCEVNISPNCCVIRDKKPQFLGVGDVLKHSVDTTRKIITAEIEVILGEDREKLLYATLEKIFIENRIYKDKEYEEAATLDAAIEHIDRRLEPFKPSFIREITRDDILKLLEIKMKRILRFNSDEANEAIAALQARISDNLDRLENIDRVTIEWYEYLKKKYGDAYPRRTLIRSFDNIQAATVAEANEKLYINREEGFIGTGLKKDEFVCNCSSIDDIIIFYRDGRYKIVRVQDKLFVGKNVLYLNVYKRNDSRTIYNVIYQNGRGGVYYMKRFAATGMTRDKEYMLTNNLQAGARIAWFTANPNGEAEIVKVTLKPKLRLKNLTFDVDFSKLAIKGRTAMGNLVTKNDVARFSLKERGASTLGGRKVWFDFDVMRINYDGRGSYLGEFGGSDRILVILPTGEYYTTGFELTNHYDEKVLKIEKFREKQVWTALLNDADQGFPYIKRFTFEDSPKRQRFVGDDARSTLIALSDHDAPMFELHFKDENRVPLLVDAEEFIGVKSFKARGKRLTTYELDSVVELEPKRPDAAEELPSEADDEPAVDVPADEIDVDQGNEVVREEHQQQSLFEDEQDL
ncbi:MAG: DNA gyrase/topoisomerase IV subunit A [Muribaculaceae bacterium]|nr:DNA gyrase/topoisomerase IV subunit A [Muribaculaceae bacterium]